MNSIWKRKWKVVAVRAPGTSELFDRIARACSVHLIQRKQISFSISPHPHTAIAMFRTALARSARCLAQTCTRTQQPLVRRAVASPFISTRISTPAISLSAVRCYASGAGLAQEEVTGRILDLLKNFDKVCNLCTER